jgi:hypothetical protein
MSKPPATEYAQTSETLDASPVLCPLEALELVLVEASVGVIKAEPFGSPAVDTPW